MIVTQKVLCRHSTQQGTSA